MSTTASAAHKHLTQREAINAALGNEQITRERVLRLERIEAALRADFERHQKLLAPLSRGFWGRLRWLVTGK